MKNPLHLLALLVFLLALFPVLVLGQGDTPEEAERWPDKGQTRSGQLEPTILEAAPEPASLDRATFEQLLKIRQRFERSGHHPEGPELKYVVPVPFEKSQPQSPPSEPSIAPRKAPDDFILAALGQPGAVVPFGFSSTVNEPTVAVKGDSVFYTGNWYAASSTNDGASFSFLNPFSAPSAPANNGFCCDQTTVYDPSTDTLFFLQQYIEDGTTGTQRINVDQGFDGTFDCFYDLTPQDVGFAANNWPDFPDLALSDNFLYHSSNVFGTGGGGFSGSFAVRYPLSQLAACSMASIQAYTDPSFGSLRFTRGATDTMYFADHVSNNSMRIWTWPEAAASPTSADRSVTAWSNATRVCPGPDGRDWCGFIDHRLMSGFVADGVVGFMWVPAQDGGHPFPYTRVARFSTGALTLLSEPEIWSASTAWVYPAAAVSGRGDLGGTILVGGGTTLYPSCAVWLADAFNGYALSPLENLAAILGTTGPSQNRSGDYTMARAHQPNDEIFVGACFAYTSTSEGNPRYVKFGREKFVQGCIFTDGFESGDTSAWN